MSVTIPKKALRKVIQLAKDNRTQNVTVSLAKGKARFECENGESVEIEGIKK